jgi:phosphatidylglycerophosphatase A
VWSPAPETKGIPFLPLIAGTFFFTGLSPVASGTVGSLAAAAIYYFVPGFQNPAALAIGCIVVLVVGIWSGGVIERALGVQDPGIVVIDEVFGQWIALAFGFGCVHDPLASSDLRFVALAFVFFRIFDVLKPPGARYFERKPGGTGIMLDDGVAGIYAGIVSRLCMYVIG